MLQKGIAQLRPGQDLSILSLRIPVGPYIGEIDGGELQGLDKYRRPTWVFRLYIPINGQLDSLHGRVRGNLNRVFFAHKAQPEQDGAGTDLAVSVYEGDLHPPGTAGVRWSGKALILDSGCRDSAVDKGCPEGVRTGGAIGHQRIHHLLSPNLPVALGNDFVAFQVLNGLVVQPLHGDDRIEGLAVADSAVHRQPVVLVFRAVHGGLDIGLHLAGVAVEECFQYAGAVGHSKGTSGHEYRRGGQCGPNPPVSLFRLLCPGFQGR